MKRRLKYLLLFFITLLIGVYVVFFLKNPTTSTEEARIVVPKGMSVTALIDSLDAHALIRSKLLFSIAARTLGASSKLHAGTRANATVCAWRRVQIIPQRHGRRDALHRTMRKRLRLDVDFQEVVHSVLTEEAEVVKALAIPGRTEWTPTRMLL